MTPTSAAGPLIETQEFDGFWWLPSDAVFTEGGVSGVPAEPSKRLTGKLTIVDGRAELSLLGNFGHAVLSETETERVYSPMPADVDRIHGLTSNGKPVTLEICDVVASSVNFPGITTTTYRARFALIGVWFIEAEEITFDEVSIHLTELDTWVGVSGLSQIMHGAEEDSGRWVPSGFDVHFELPKSIEISLDTGAKATIDFGYSVSGSDPVQVRAEITQRTSLYFRWGDAQGLEVLPKTVGQLRNFFSLAVGKPLTVLAVTGYQDDLKARGGQAASREPIQVFWQIGHNPKPTDKKLHPTQMLFRLPDVESEIGSILSGWFSRQDVFEPVFDLYFAMLYHPSMYSEVQFLLYAQAIETYDFRRRDPNELDPREHKQRVKEIVDAAPKRWKTWLNTKLLGSNFRTLDQRLRDVLAECPTVSGRIVGSTDEELNEFVRSVKNTRNYYTHYTPDLERKAATDLKQRYVLTLQLRAIIEMVLLRELGFSCEAIDYFLDRVQRYYDIQRFRVMSPEGELD